MPQSFASPRQMRGISLIGFIIIFGLVGFFGLVAAKALPVWTEYFAAVKLAKKIEGSTEMDVGRLRRDWDLTASIDRVEAVKGSDLRISVAGGKKTVEFDYDAKVHVFGNTYLLFMFDSKGVGSAPAND